MINPAVVTIDRAIDCAILLNAVRDYCQKVADEYHTNYLQAIAIGNNKAADKCRKWRNEVASCEIRMTERLELAMRKLEDQE